MPNKSKTRAAIFSNGTISSTLPCAMASLGIPNTTQLASHLVLNFAAFIVQAFHSGCAIFTHTVSITLTAWALVSAATELNSTSTSGAMVVNWRV